LEISSPFDGDLLLRKKLAATLTGFIGRLGDGAVIGITANWGEGKTWFGRNWAESLKSEHRVAFIDAFENDYVQDPFLIIASELTQIVEGEGTGVALRKRATSVFKAMVPLGTKAIINLAGRVLIGSQSLSGDIEEAISSATETAADQSEKWLEERFKELGAQRASLNGFKKALAEAVSKSEKPVVVFIDELDRCKPTFAVTLIERLKHLFDVPNLVFVLLMNREQLEHSIAGHYGPGTDGQAYLGKFVNLWFELPRPGQIKNEPDRRYEAFVESALSIYRKPGGTVQTIDDFKTYCALWASKWSMSLRDIERMCTLFVLAEMKGPPLLWYLIALKVKNPNRFTSIRRHDLAALALCVKDLNSLIKNPDDYEGLEWPEIHFASLAELHSVLIGKMKFEESKMLRKYTFELIGNHRDASRAFQVLADNLDLPLDAF